MPNVQKLFSDCWAKGINTLQSRGDRFQMRAYLEHQLNGGQLKWIAQTASEMADIGANIGEIARYKPIAIYHTAPTRTMPGMPARSRPSATS